jgi:hypothetical protein
MRDRRWSIGTGAAEDLDCVVVSIVRHGREPWLATADVTVGRSETFDQRAQQPLNPVVDRQVGSRKVVYRRMPAAVGSCRFPPPWTDEDHIVPVTKGT